MVRESYDSGFGTSYTYRQCCKSQNSHSQNRFFLNNIFFFKQAFNLNCGDGHSRIFKIIPFVSGDDPTKDPVRPTFFI